MPNYVHEWTEPSTGYGHKLELLTYDTPYGGADTAVDVGLFVEVAAEYEKAFDELPVGMQIAPTMDVTVDFSVATTAQKTYLRNAESGSKKNLWIYSTNYGSGLEVEFVGVQATSEAGKYTREHKDGRWIAEYKIVDAFWELCKSLDGRSMCSWVVAGSDSFPTLFDVDFATPADRTDYRYNIDAFRGGICKPNSMYGVTLGIGQQLSSLWTLNYLHITDAFDLLDIINDEPVNATNTLGAGLASIWTRAVTLYGTNQTVPRAVGSALTASTALLPTHIYDGDELIGGYASPKDSTGLGQYQSCADWLKDLAENFAVKIPWRYSKQTASGGADFIGVDMQVRRIFDQSITKVINLDDQLNGAIEVEEAGSVISKVEARWEGEDEDLTEIVVQSNSSRKQRSFTLQCKIHNNPMTKEFTRAKSGLSGARDAITNGLPKSNVVCFDIGGSLVKAHERVDINDGAGATSYTTSNSEYPTTGEDLTPTDASLWCLSVQEAAGMPYALASFYLSAFGDRTQSVIEFDVPLASYTDWDLYHRVSFTGAGTTTLSHITWTNGVVTKIVKKPAEGLQTITVLMAPNV